MNQTLTGLGIGLALAIVVIFLLLGANFQSLRLPLVVLSTAPAVLLGVAVMLWITGTSLNVQSFMGAIMAVGVSVANANSAGHVCGAPPKGRTAFGRGSRLRRT